MFLSFIPMGLRKETAVMAEGTACHIIPQAKITSGLPHSFSADQWLV